MSSKYPSQQWNRREGHWTPVFGVGLVLAAVLCMCYLLLQGRCETIGEETRKQEEELVRLQHRLADEESRWLVLKSPQEIEKALRQHNLPMAWPTREQIVRLPAAGISVARVDPQAPKKPAQFASR